MVNADSMQLYRGMDIGTAKLPEGERRGIPHHLLDVLDIVERASVAAYQRAARASIEDILSRGLTPLLVGGSGLYLQAVVDEIDFPGTDPVVRARLESELAEQGVEASARPPDRLDPVAAQRISHRDGRRIVRALEVVELTGRPYSASMPTSAVRQVRRRRGVPGQAGATAGRRPGHPGGSDDRTGLPRRGPRTWPASGLREGPTAAKALGYAQLLRVIDGAIGLPDAVRDTVSATRRFVRRQRSWFARNPRALRMNSGPGTAELLGPVLARRRLAHRATNDARRSAVP